MNPVGTATARLMAMVERALLGRRDAVELAATAFAAGGHLLIEDVPGVGKTTLARALAKATGGEFRRIQFTSDLLPADITGVSVWNPRTGELTFKEGAVFGNVVLSDEINRAPPKTQSALLEAMSEGQVSADGVSRSLPRPFMVVATQNLEEHHGTYPLPESQLDRFMMRIEMGYPDRDLERQVIARPTLEDPVAALEPVFDEGGVEELYAAVDAVHVEPPVVDYLMDLVQLTRSSDLLHLGVSPRGGMALHRAARALATVRGRDFALVDDVKELAVPLLAHRVIPAGATGDPVRDREASQRVVRELADSVEIPL